MPVAAQQAGLSVRVEPDTHSLLLAQFSKEECRHIFPKVSSSAFKAQFVNVMKAIEVATASNLTDVEKQNLLKFEKCSRLIAVARKQVIERKRSSMPQFVPFAAAANGELCSPAVALQEWLVDK